MRFIMLLKATKETEAGMMPSDELIRAMTDYNESMVRAGVLLDGGGLHPSSAGVRITWADGQPSASEGPFPETGSLIAGYWQIQVDSKEEAIAWAMRCPSPHGGDEGEIELRQLYETSELTEDEELLQKDAEMREQEERNRGA